jgi:hypothetical protein
VTAVLEGRHPQPAPTLTTAEEWARFCEQAAPRPPQRPSRAQCATMPEHERQAFDEARLVHHGSFGPVNTPAMERIHQALWRQVRTNFHVTQPGARRGTCIDGLGNLGKTTLITAFGKLYERDVRRRYPAGVTENDDLIIPVVYVTVPAEATIKWLDLAILQFYGAPVSTADTKWHLAEKIRRYARRTATSLFLIDDIHYLDVRNRFGRAVSDHLKNLASTIAATFVYAGIGCEDSGLLNEGHGESRRAFSQTRSRFSLHRMASFDISTAEGAAEWSSLLKRIEAEILLLEATPGMLCTKLARYCFERTDGVIGALSQLVREGANLAIERGTERLTEGLLDEIVLDHASESRGRVRRQAAGKGRPGGTTA